MLACAEGTNGVAMRDKALALIERLPQESIVPPALLAPMLAQSDERESPGGSGGTSAE